MHVMEFFNYPQSNKDDFVPFVADPAKLREAAEMRRRSQGRGRGRGGGATGPPRNRDVVGGAKGMCVDHHMCIGSMNTELC